MHPRILEPALVGREWSASNPGRLTSTDISPRYTLDRGLGGLQSRSGRHGKEKNLAPHGTRTLTPRPSILKKVTILTALS
jgi:hypothetical protein